MEDKKKLLEKERIKKMEENIAFLGDTTFYGLKSEPEFNELMLNKR